MRYRVAQTGHVNHDQQDYPPGSYMELSPDDAAPLLACGAIEREVQPFSAASEQAKTVNINLEPGA